MTTEQLVARLIELVHQGKNVQAEEELYAQDVVSYEQDGTSATGLEAVIAKTKAAHDAIGEFHGGGIVATYIGTESFLLKFNMDVTFKGGNRATLDEYGFYKVKDGKVVEEYFFMQPAEIKA